MAGNGGVDDGLDPSLFGISGRFHHRHPALLAFSNDVGGMLALFVEHVRIADREARLRDREDEVVGEVAAMHTVQGRDPVRPFLGQGLAAAALDLIARALGIGGADLKAGREDQAIQLIFNAIDHHAAFGDLLHAFALGVDEGHIGPVEGVQIVIVETGALTELVVPRLELVGGCLVGHDLIDARADLLHLAEIGQLQQFGRIASGSVGGLFLTDARDDADIADDIGPAVRDQILWRIAARDEDVEIVHPVLLPAGLKTARPFWIGRTIVAQIDG